MRIQQNEISAERTRLNLDLYAKVYLIRMAEEKIRRHYPEDEMFTPVHLSIGEEAIAAGICQALGPADQLFGTYRSHGIYLARTGETDKFFAELYGRETGAAKGRAGSMHLSLPDVGFCGSSAVVGTIIPIAVGAAFADKRKKNNNITAVFFGDGALEEGVFWESINAASLMKLPVLFICEDNGLAIHSTIAERQGFNSIGEIVSKFKCNVFTEESTDPEIIHSIACKAIGAINGSGFPSFMHLKYYRYLEHVGIEEDFQFGYRSRKEFEHWLKIDPVKIQREKLKTLGVPEDEISEMESEINRRIAESIRFAKKSPFPPDGSLCEDICE